MGKVGLFLDRDGTICIDWGYLISAEKMELLPNSAEALKKINKLNIPIIVLTNQSGIARKYFNEDTVLEANEKLKSILLKSNAHIDEVFYCPHHPDAGCWCRKPNSGLLEESAKKYNIDPLKSFVIGDKLTDIELGRKCGSKTVLVLTGYGKDEQKDIKESNKPDYIAEDLLDAVEWIINEINIFQAKSAEKY